ncbi:hypothetical protein ABPG73_022320 [Tetrahymena malaccensis]
MSEVESQGLVQNEQRFDSNQNFRINNYSHCSPEKERDGSPITQSNHDQVSPSLLPLKKSMKVSQFQDFIKQDQNEEAQKLNLEMQKYDKGQYLLKDNENLTFKINNCYLKIYDYDQKTLKDSDSNFYSISSIPSSIDQNMLMKFAFPDIKMFGVESQLSYTTTNEGSRSFEIFNAADSIDCEILLIAYQQTTIQQLTIDCGASQCFIINQSKLITFESVNASGQSIDFNSSYLKVNNLSVTSFFGQIEFNELEFTQASLEVSTGDISVQSTKSIQANLSMVSKLYCASTYSNIPITSSIVDVSPNCSPVFAFGASVSNQQNIVAQRCFQGSLTVKSSGSEPNQILNAKNTFGNIFINLLQKSGASALENQQIFYDKQVYGQDGNNINLSTLSLNNLYNQLNDTANSNSKAQKMLSFGWQNSVGLPQVKFIDNLDYDGKKQIDFSNTYNDDWLVFNLQNDGTVSVDSTNIERNQILLAAVIVSFILAVILGIVLLIAIVYVINKNYLQTLNHINHVDTYYKVQKQQGKIQGRQIELEELDAQENENKDSNNNNDNDEIRRISGEIKKQKLSIAGLFNLFYTLIYLSPPLNAYIDQVILLFYKARVNSATSFFNLLFVEEKQSKENEDQIHNLEKDSIPIQDMKCLYEQYCYLNQFLERKLEDKQNINTLKQLGFKISVKQDALVSYYTYIICNGTNNAVSQNFDGKNSLDQFIKKCCQLTKFDSDSIDSLTFEKYYSEFCNKNHLEKVQLNENQLKREYGIETRFIPKQIIERDQDYDINKKQFKQLSEEGCKKLISFIKDFSGSQFKEIIKKMDITQKIEDALPTSQIKSLISEAENNNLVDPKLGQIIKDNIEIIARDPSAVAYLGQEVYDIAQNAQSYSQNLMQKLESKVQEELFNQVDQYLPSMSKSFICVLKNLFSEQKNRLKNDLPILFKDLIAQYKLKHNVESNEKVLNFLEILKGPIMPLIFDIAQPEKEEKLDDIKNKFMRNICAIIFQTMKIQKNLKACEQGVEQGLEASNLIEELILISLKLYQYKNGNQFYEKVQNFFNLFDILINDPIADQKKLQQNSQKLYGVSNKIVNFIVNCMSFKFNLYDKEESRFNTLIKIFNNGQQKEQNLTLFLQYLLNKQPDQSIFLLIACMYTYLNGDAQDIEIEVQEEQNKNQGQQRKMNIEQYLSKQLGIKKEFFSALPSLFIDDTYIFAQEFIKFYRQEDYQIQRKEKLQIYNIKNNSVAPMNTKIKEQKNVENFINRITLQDKELEQFINIFSKNPINSSFFSREFSLPLDLVELLQVVCLIKYSDEENRKKKYESLEQNKSCVNICSKLGVDLGELVTCVKILYQDFDVSDSQELQNKLKLHKDFPIALLQNLLNLQSNSSSKQEEIQTRVFELKKLIKQNYFYKDNQNDDLIKWYQLLKAMQHDFLLISSFDQDIEMLQSCKDIKSIVAIIGCLQNKKLETQPRVLFSQIYYKLKAKNRLFGQYDDKGKQQETNEQAKNQRENQVTCSIQKSSTFEYAIYQLCQEMFISPVWMLLISGNYDTWRELCVTYYEYYKYENNEKTELNPLQALIMVLNIKQCPTIIKEYLIQNELAIVSSSIFKRNLFDFKCSKLENEQHLILRTVLFKEIKNFTKLAQKVKFPQKVLDLIAWYELKNSAQGKNTKFQLRETEKWLKLFSDKKLNISYRFYNFSNLETNAEQFNCYTQAKQIFKYLNMDLCNYNYEDDNTQQDQKDKISLAQECINKELNNQERQNLRHIYATNELMQIIWISTLSNLQTAYDGYQEQNDRDKSHFRLITYEIDLLLSIKEYFYFFDEKNSSKYKIFYIIGLACGFKLNLKDILKCKTSYSLYSFTKMDVDDINFFEGQILEELIQIINQRDYEKNLFQELKKVIDEQQMKNGDDKILYDELMQAKNARKKNKNLQKQLNKIIDKRQDKNENYKSLYQKLKNIIDETQNKNNNDKILHFRKFDVEIFKHFFNNGYYDSFINNFNIYIHKLIDYKNVKSILDLDQSHCSQEVLRDQQTKQESSTENKEDAKQNDVEDEEIDEEKEDDRDNEEEEEEEAEEQEQDQKLKKIAKNNIVKDLEENYDEDDDDEDDDEDDDDKDEDDDKEGQSIKEQLGNKELFVKQEKEFNNIQTKFTNFIDFYRGTYKSILQDKKLTEKYQKEIKQIVSILNLNGALKAQNDQINLEYVVDNLSIVSEQLQSNQRALIQLILLFIDGHDFSLPSLTDIFEMKTLTFKSFANCYLNQSQFTLEDDIESLLSQTSYSVQNKEVIKKTIKLYQGEITEIMSLASYSEYFDDKDSNSYKSLYQLMYAFDKTQNHKKSLSNGKLSIIDFMNLSSEVEDNEKQQNKIIENICLSVYSQQVYSQENKRMQINFSKPVQEIINEQIKIIRSICKNNWSFINKIHTENVKMKAFCNLFKLDDQQFELIQALSIIKPNIFKKKRTNRLNELFSGEDKKFIKIFKTFGICQTQEEAQQLLILACVANQSLPHLAALLNKVINDKQFLAQEANNSQNKLKHSQNNLGDGQKPQIDLETLDQQNQAEEDCCRQELSQLLLSVLMIKISRKINWMELKGEINESMANYICSGFDVFSGIFENYCKHQDCSQTQQSSKLSEASQKCQNSINYFDKFKFEIYQQFHKTYSNQNNVPMIFYQDFLELTKQNIESKDFKFSQLITGQYYLHASKLQCTDIFLKLQMVSLMLQLDTSKLKMRIQTYQEKSQISEKSQITQITDLLNQIAVQLAQVINNLQFQQKKKKNANFKSIIKLVKTLYYNLNFISQEPQKTQQDKFNIKFLKKIKKLVLSKDLESSDQQFKKLDQYFVKFLNKISPQVFKYLKKDNKISKIYQQLHNILERPLLNLQDKHFVEDLQELLQVTSNGQINSYLMKRVIKIVIKNDYTSLLEIIEHCDLVPSCEFKTIKETIKKVSSLSIYGNRGALENLNKPKPVISDQMKEIRKKLLEGKMTPQDIFYSIDSLGNRDGTVSIQEFCNFLRRTGINMSQHRVNELFATIKKNRKSALRKFEDNDLNLEEFEEAYKYINDKKVDMSLEKLGISPALLALSLGTLIIILILLLVFIFLGIKAFALGGTFGSIINSIIPTVATTGTASSSHDKTDSLKDENVKGALKDAQSILHSNQL